MLNLFRRFTNSKAGVIVTFLVLGVIALAFALGDVTGLTPNTSGGLGGGEVAEVGDAAVTTSELREAARNEVEFLGQRQPGFTLTQYLAAGGLDATLERLVASRSLHQFGQDQGMVVSKRSIDGQIASIPAFLGPTGRFDQNLYNALLAQRRLSDAQVRADIAREIMAQRLTAPQLGASQVPAQLALPYASLLLERRSGQIGFIPTSAVNTGPAPSAAEVAAFYQRNLNRYTVPERRVVRYALVTPDRVAARAQPTEAEIRQAYDADRAKYAPTERRTVAQVVVADQAGANRIAQSVRGGRSIADAARAAGLEATTQNAVEKAAYSRLAGQAAADAVFSAQRGALVGPVRGPLGFVVARVENVEQVAGKSLDQARAEIAATLRQRKTAEALADVQARVDDALNESATFDEIMADQRLQPVTTPPLLADGTNPENPSAPADPAIAPILQAAYASEQGDAPQLVPVGRDGAFAVVAVGNVVPAAPRPLQQIRDQVTRDLVADRARQAARRIATQVSDKVGRGVPLVQALRETGLALPAPRPVDVPRSQLASNPRGVEPALALLFSMAPGTAKVLEQPNLGGWLVVRLDRVQPGDARGNRQLVQATRADLGRVIGREYAEQFARAARNAVGVKVDRGAVGRIRAELSGQGQ